MKLDYLPSFFTLFYSLPSKGSISELSGLVLKQTPFSDTFVTQTLPISCEAWVSCGSESRNGTGGMGGQRGGAYRVITINLSMRFRANKKLLSQLEYESEKNRKLSPQFFFPGKKHRHLFFSPGVAVLKYPFVAEQQPAPTFVRWIGGINIYPFVTVVAKFLPCCWGTCAVFKFIWPSLDRTRL